MRALSRHRRRGPGEDGSALIIALFFATIFSLLVATVISFAEVGLKASASFDGRAKDLYATDGAVSAAINRFRRGGPCDDYTAPADSDGEPLDGQGVIVRCVDDKRPTSGAATRPVNALLSLGTLPTDGIATVGTQEQRILGNIYSNSTVTAGGTLIVQGQVSAAGDCTPLVDIQTLPDPAAKHCANSGGYADVSQGRDPDYTKASATVPVRRTVPACPAGWLVEIEPGYYDDAAALSAFTTTAGSCPGKVVWFKPGNYYLDFTFRGGAGTWTVNDPNVVVVAGTPRDWVPDPALPRPAIPLPGSCRTAADPAPNAGVQLVAGGGTHLDITQGRVELCAEPTLVDQSIALYGIPRDRPVHTLAPTDWTAVDRFTDPGNAAVIGEVRPAPASSPATATAALTPGTPPSLTLTAFRPGVPAGSVVDSAVLRVVHQDSGDVDAGSVKVAAAFPGSTCAGVLAVGVPARATLTQDRIDLKQACGLKDPAAFDALSVTYSAGLATGGTAGTDVLDGIAVEVSYRTPRTGRPTAVPSSSGFTSPTNPPAFALEIGEQPSALTADAALSATGPTAASITVAGLGDPPIALGSKIDSAVLRVAHREQGDDTAAPAPTLTVPFAGGTCDTLPLPVSATSITDHRIDLKACGLDDAAELVGLSARYDVSLAGGTTATANLDGMWLELVYRPPTRSPATVTPTVFADADFAKVVGETPTPLTADAILRPGGPTSASLLLADYGQPPLPPGSIMDSAVLRVAHQDVGPMDTPALDVTFPGIGTCAPVLTRRAAALGEDTLDLKACGLADPVQLAGLSVTYGANLSAGATADATAKVDGVVLDLAYRPPSVRRPAIATTTTPGFSAPDNAKANGESPTPLTADVTLNQGAAPASVTLTGYDANVPLPAGSVVDSAVLRVAHQDDAWMGPPTLGATFTGSTPGCPGLTATSPVRPALGDDTLDLTACGLTRAEQLADLTATYTANAPTTTTGSQVPATTTLVNGFANADNARAIDALTADAALDSAGTATASITLDGYDQAPPPVGSAVSAAVLRIAHQEDSGAAAGTATVSFNGSTCSPQLLASRPTLAEDTIDLAACGFTDPAQLPGLTVAYDAGLAGGATAGTARLDGAVIDVTYQAPSGSDHLDGVELDVVFRVPTYRPLDGCVADPGTGACALVRVAPGSNDVTTRFAAQGTVYAPTTLLDISMYGLKDQVLTRGLIGRAIRLGLKADPGYKRPLMGVPPEPVKFTAYPAATSRATGPIATPAPEWPASSSFATPDKARDIDGVTCADPAKVDCLAAATFNSTAPLDASIRLGGYTHGSLTGAVDAVVLRLVHREDAAIDSASVTFGGIPGACATKTFPVPLYTPPAATPLAMDEYQIDLTNACGFDIGQLSGLTVTYKATVASAPATNQVAYLDGITLDLLAGPLLRARVAFDVTQDKVQVQGWSVLR
ncbi:MAG TPA: hypothetical protein VMZ51_06260 [Acidimicrobiales bacterium]|nr:hypothetical protein [Acidimicrobiales bacterium]